MPSTVDALLRDAGLPWVGAVRWHERPPLGGPGVYLVARAKDPAALPANLAAPPSPAAQAEQRLIEAFCVGVSSATRTSLHDPEQPLPFANLQRRPGVWKRHGLGGYRRVQPRPGPRCPDCGDGDRVLPIVYGSPAAALVEAFERGEVQLGGCTEMPQQWYCGRCGLQWPDALDSVERSR